MQERKQVDFDWSETVRAAERHIAKGRITAAIVEYHKLVDSDPTDLTTLNTLGDLYARAGLNEEAKRIFAQVARGYSHQGFNSKAIALLKKILRNDPNDIDSAHQLAECYLAQGLRGEAGRQFAEVANACERYGRGDQAFAAYQRMAEIDPSNTALLMNLGERWLTEGMVQRAHSSFSAAGNEYSRQGDDERALAAYLKAQTVKPDEHKTLAAITAICAARGQAESAIPILYESIERNSADVELYKILGSAYLSAGKLEEAARTFQTLITLDGNEYQNLLRVGECFLEQGEPDRAVEQIDGIVDLLIVHRNEQLLVDFLRNVLAGDPGHSPSLRRLALIFRRLREDFNLIPVLKALAHGAIRRGDTDEAIDTLKELCSLEPREKSHIDALRKLGVEVTPSSYALYSPSKRAWEYPTSVITRDSGSSSQRALTSTFWSDEPFQQASSPQHGDSQLEIFAPQGNSQEAYEGIEIADRNQFVLATEIYDFGRLIQAGSIAGPERIALELEALANRRRAPRVLANVPLVVISEAGGWREFTQTLDVCDGGLKFQLAHNVAPLTVLRVSVNLAKWPGAVAKTWVLDDTNCIVRYCIRRAGQPNLVGVDLLPAPQLLTGPESRSALEL